MLDLVLGGPLFVQTYRRGAVGLPRVHLVLVPPLKEQDVEHWVAMKCGWKSKMVRRLANGGSDWVWPNKMVVEFL